MHHPSHHHHHHHPPSSSTSIIIHHHWTIIIIHHHHPFIHSFHQLSWPHPTVDQSIRIRSTKSHGMAAAASLAVSLASAGVALIQVGDRPPKNGLVKGGCVFFSFFWGGDGTLNKKGRRAIYIYDIHIGSMRVVYLPTAYHKIQQHVGEYTMIGSYGLYDMKWVWDMRFSYTVPAGPIQWRIFKMGWCIHCSYKKVRLYRLETRAPCADAYHFWMTHYFHFEKRMPMHIPSHTLPKTNIFPENRPSQKWSFNHPFSWAVLNFRGVWAIDTQKNWCGLHHARVKHTRTLKSPNSKFPKEINWSTTQHIYFAKNQSIKVGLAWGQMQSYPYHCISILS